MGEEPVDGEVEGYQEDTCLSWLDEGQGKFTGSGYLVHESLFQSGYDWSLWVIWKCLAHRKLQLRFGGL